MTYEKLTGIGTERRDQAQPLEMAAELGGRLDPNQSDWERYFMFPFLDAGKPKRCSPHFVVNDSGARRAARYAVSGDWAGAHMYCVGGDCPQAGCALVTLHSGADCHRRVTPQNGKEAELTLLPCFSVLLDALSGQVLMPRRSSITGRISCWI